MAPRHRPAPPPLATAPRHRPPPPLLARWRRRRPPLRPRARQRRRTCSRMGPIPTPTTARRAPTTARRGRERLQRRQLAEGVERLQRWLARGVESLHTYGLARGCVGATRGVGRKRGC
eukprot:5228809-Prymnesium_polylepis.1